MSSDNLAQRLAVLGKPIAIDYPNENGDTTVPLVAAVNAARETGMAQLLYSFGSDYDQRSAVMNELVEKEIPVRDLRRGLEAASLHPGELIATIHAATYEGERRGTDYFRIDVICTDHPTQRDRKPMPLTESEARTEFEKRR